MYVSVATTIREKEKEWITLNTWRTIEDRNEFKKKIVDAKKTIRLKESYLLQ